MNATAKTSKGLDFPHDFNSQAPFGDEWTPRDFKASVIPGMAVSIQNQIPASSPEVRGWWGVYTENEWGRAYLIHLPTGRAIASRPNEPGAIEELRDLSIALDQTLDEDGAVDLEELERQLDSWREQRVGGES